MRSMSHLLPDLPSQFTHWSKASLVEGFFMQQLLPDAAAYWSPRCFMHVLCWRAMPFLLSSGPYGFPTAFCINLHDAHDRTNLPALTAASAAPCPGLSEVVCIASAELVMLATLPCKGLHGTACDPVSERTAGLWKCCACLLFCLPRSDLSQKAAVLAPLVASQSRTCPWLAVTELRLAPG